LEWLASDVAEYSDIATKVNVLGTERRLPEEVELVLFRITQEALRNVWRHAQATQAEVTIEFDRGKVRITVSDNGKGFNLPNTIGDFVRDGKLGLAGMQERARLVNGTLTMQSEPGKGTSIVVEIPA
jgi:signal transduction histidine kinase